MIIYFEEPIIAEINPKTRPHFIRRWKILNYIGLAAYVVTVCGIFTCGCVFLLFPHHRRYWHYNLLSPNLQSNVLVMSCLFIIELGMCGVTWPSYFTEAFLNILYIDTLANALRILKNILKEEGHG